MKHLGADAVIPHNSGDKVEMYRKHIGYKDGIVLFHFFCKLNIVGHLILRSGIFPESAESISRVLKSTQA